MRTLLIPLAIAGAALVTAAPAAAQYYPSQPYGYGYNGYGSNGYGYNGRGYSNYGQVRALHARIDRIEWQINRLDRYGNAGGMADRLRDQARRLEYRLNSAARNGLNPYEANDIQVRISQLEERVQYLSRSRYGYGNNGYPGNGYYNQEGRGHWDGDRDQDRDDDRD